MYQTWITIYLIIPATTLHCFFLILLTCLICLYTIIYVYPCNLVAIDISLSPDRAEQSSHVPLPAHPHLRGQNFPTDHHNPKADVLWSLHSISCTETRLAVFGCFQILSIVITKCCCFYRLVGPWNVSMWRITAIMVDYILFL